MTFQSRRYGILFLLFLIVLVEGQGCSYKKFRSLPTDASGGDASLGTGDPDPYYEYQWYLGGKTVSSTVTFGVPEVWYQKNLGQEAQIAIVDPSSIYLNHPDITDNKELTKSFNFLSPARGTDTTFSGGSSHGSCVAGVIGARELNGKGIIGVSPRAKISARTTTGIDTDIYDAITYKFAETDVISNSYGPPDNVVELNQLYNQDLFKQGINLGINSGRGGLGTVYVWAAGNGRQNSDRSNYDGYASHHGVMSICSIGMSGSVSFFSEPGANLWVCAPGEKVVTTDYQGFNCSDNSNSPLKDLPNPEYTQNFTGTSAATPFVSGVVGLLLTRAKQLNKSLGWRDVKMIIAESASKPSNIQWQGTRIKFNDDIGFGIINAFQALELLKTWVPVGNSPWIASVLGSGFLGPEFSGSLDDSGGGYLNMKNFVINNSVPQDGISLFHSSINYIEHVILEVRLTHSDPGDLEINLEKSGISGGGNPVISKITTAHNCIDGDQYTSCSSASNYTYEFGVSNFLGESAQGIWALKIRDARSNGKTGSVVGWRLKIYGH